MSERPGLDTPSLVPHEGYSTTVEEHEGHSTSDKNEEGPQ
jgi:hypothetical protein